MASQYWTRLAVEGGELQTKVDAALKMYRLEPAGSGYIDIITPPGKAGTFLEEMAQLGIAAHVVTMWCRASDDNKDRYGCPHGLGGPVQRGIWFSEMCEMNPFDVEDHGISVKDSTMDPWQLANACKAKVLEYIHNGMRERPEWSPCLCPGIWLAVPDDWVSEAPTDRA